MYKPYTTIGTNKQTHTYEIHKGIRIFFAVIWFLAVTVSRVLYLFCGGGASADTYGLFARAMVRMEAGAPSLDSGLAYAYTRSLSRLLRFAGNRIEAVTFYQMILQILWLILLFAGISLLFGYVAGAVAGSVLAASPWIVATIFTIWPGNYYMLHFALALVLLGGFGRRAKKERWPANDFSRLLLIAAGFYAGVLCIWNILGILLAFVMVYILLRNYLSFRKEHVCKKEETEAEPAHGAKRRAMGAGTQAAVLGEGILFGIFATLMKYTGVTGEAIAGQAMWWLSQLKNPFAQYREMQIPLIGWLLGAVGAGILCQLLFLQAIKRRYASETGLLTKKKELSTEDERRDKTPGRMDGYGKETEKEMTAKGEEGKYIITEDGRRIKLLDNPLPGPKKHVRREMDFDFDIEEEVKDDFDIKIKDGDDFDFE